MPPSPPTHLRPPPAALAPAPPPSGPPLLLTIRFSAALPDLELDIPRPQRTTVVSLKHTIRGRLADPEDRRRRLRFIHGGKILPDAAALGAVLRVPPPPPRGNASSRYYGGGGDDKKAAGKEGGGEKKGGRGPEPDRGGKGKSVAGRPDPAQRIYVNCSIGDALSTAELEAEATAAAIAAPAPVPPSPLLTPSSSPLLQPLPAPSTSAAPRGFERLLAAGLTAAEVNQLRLQFRSVHASRYTPDTLPSPDSFRRMEDAWIDDGGGGGSASMASSAALGAGAGDSGGGNGTDSDDVGLVALVDVMIRGVLTGFLWPLGSAGWLVREEGMASGRSRFMVGVGVIFSLLIGIIRSISGDK
ncbi:DUF2407 C-terminal domain-containing protein [Hypoxylon sp. FL1284]|nr:DUF2407 C-terminal domain-containing protein [Hypoxylon sp. FL1284]